MEWLGQRLYTFKKDFCCILSSGFPENLYQFIITLIPSFYVPVLTLKETKLLLFIVWDINPLSALCILKYFPSALTSLAL